MEIEFLKYSNGIINIKLHDKIKNELEITSLKLYDFLSNSNLCNPVIIPRPKNTESILISERK